MSVSILVVDDEDPIRRLVRSLLERQGYTVVAACSGEEAFELFQQEPHGFHLLVTDATMPTMTGLELADLLRKIRPELRVLFISGDVPLADRGFGCLAKPFTSAQFVTRVRQVLTEPPE